MIFFSFKPRLPHKELSQRNRFVLKVWVTIHDVAQFQWLLDQKIQPRKLLSRDWNEVAPVSCPRRLASAPEQPPEGRPLFYRMIPARRLR